MHSYDEPDFPELPDTSPSEPAGQVPVSFSVPVPHIDQVMGEIARQIIRAQGYEDKRAINAKVEEKIDDLITGMVTAKASEVIAQLLDNPLLPTDNFGNPTGERTSLNAVLAKRVNDWCNDLVDREGRPKTRDAYNSGSVATRMEWVLGQIVNAELRKLVDKEVSRIVTELKRSATENIAKQIAEKISGLVLK